MPIATVVLDTSNITPSTILISVIINTTNIAATTTISTITTINTTTTMTTNFMSVTTDTNVVLTTLISKPNYISQCICEVYLSKAVRLSFALIQMLHRIE